jgi:conjugal transfer mating pair stabilization protein TraN
MATYDLAKKLEVGTRLAQAGLNVPGAWAAVRNWVTSSWSTITQPFTSAWGSLVQSYGGAAVDAIEDFSLEALEKEMTTATANFVADLFGPEVAGLFFGGTTDAATGEFVADGTLSEGFATALNFIMWVYTIYIIVNILINIIWKCEQSEFMLAARREMMACTRIGTYCKSDSVFGCIEKRDAYCCYNSPLSRIVMEGAAPQLGLTLGDPQTPDCHGLTLAQVAQLDWSQIDLQQWYGIIAANGLVPATPEEFEAKYSLDNVTRNPYSQTPAPSAPERTQAEVDAAQFFDEATKKVRGDLWDAAR